jgi:iron complex outermembrane receptor protein
MFKLESVILTATIISCVFTVKTVNANESEVNEEKALEIIAVTAQKRRQSIQDVGVSMTALSDKMIKSLGITDTVNISQQIPGLQVNKWSPTLTAFNLRGISQNNFTDNLEAPIAVYSDDVYIGSMNAVSGQMFDMERVEVLRGPQGTLFGRNATGGLIHYLSRDASSEDTNGYIETSFSQYQTKSIEGAIGGSLNENVRARFAARMEKGNGYVSATVPGVRDIGGLDGYAFRTAIQVDFSDTLTGDFMLKYSKDDDVPTGGYAVYAQGGDAVDVFTGLALKDNTEVRPFEHDSDYQGYLDRELTSYTGKFSWELEQDLDFVSVTNYTTMDKFYTEDGDAFPVLAVNFTTIADFSQFSQEFRLSGYSQDQRWQIGAYYLNMKNDNQSIVEGIPGTVAACQNDLIALPNFTGSTCFDYAPGGVGAPEDIAIPDGSSTIQYVNMNTKNHSIFGEYEYDFIKELTLVLGYRWSKDQKDIQFSTAYANNTSVTTPIETFNADSSLADAGLSDHNKIDYIDYAARIRLDWKLQENTLVFASFNRGIKGGNWSVNSRVTPAKFRHDGETLYAYELGIKTELNNMLRFNAAAFYYDYKDYQSFSLTGLTPQISNTDASIQGGELEALIIPNQHWEFILGASFLDSEVDEVFDANGGVMHNNEMPNAPGVSLNFLGRYGWNSSAGRWSIQFDGVSNSKQYLEVTNGETSEEGAYSVLNAKLSFIAQSELWQIDAWVKNITNEEYRLYNLDLGRLGATSFYAPPQWYGVNIRFNF